MRVLITGGAGFIGSSLAKSLLKDGHKVSIMDNFSTGNKSNLDDIICDVGVIDIDLSDNRHIDVMDSWVGQADVVYHFAASIGVKLITENPTSTLHNSLNINNNLFPLFEKYQPKVIFASTSEVYGETKSVGGSREDDKLEIFPPRKPRGSYACSKLMSEFLISSYTFPNVIVRFFNIVGPTQMADYGHVLPRFIKQLEEGEHLSVYGDGQQVRSFCDIRDAVEMLLILVGDEHDGEIYNIGNDLNRCTMNELADTCIRASGTRALVRHTPIRDVGVSFEEIYTRFPNTDKIKQYYICKYNLGDIIENIGSCSTP
jgi:UDP-glucose 4-epimerase